MFCIYFELLQIAQSIMLHHDFFVCNIYIMIFTKMVIIVWNMQTLLFLCKYLVVFDDPPLYVPHLIAEIDSNLEQLP